MAKSKLPIGTYLITFTSRRGQSVRKREITTYLDPTNTAALYALWDQECGDSCFPRKNYTIKVCKPGNRYEVYRSIDG